MEISSNFILQAIENVFAIGKKLPVGPCFCQPTGGFYNHSAPQMEIFEKMDAEMCKVSFFWGFWGCMVMPNILSIYFILNLKPSSTNRRTRD